jgi:quinol monooxygenase YgiN
MTFANVGTLGAVSGKRDELVRHLTRRSETLRQIGCLAYEVGVNDDDPDTVFVVELWESEEAHRSPSHAGGPGVHHGRTPATVRYVRRIPIRRCRVAASRLMTRV